MCCVPPHFLVCQVLIHWHCFHSHYLRTPFSLLLGFAFLPFRFFLFFFSPCAKLPFLPPLRFLPASFHSVSQTEVSSQMKWLLLTGQALEPGSGWPLRVTAQLALRLRRWGCSRHPHPNPSWQQKQEHQQGHCSTLGHRNTFVEESARSIPRHAKRTALSHWSANESSGGCWQDTLTPGPTCTLQWLQVKQTEPSASSSCPYWDPQSCYCVQTKK